jgi:TfoX/Sxy family transcriptional regulator of competence genes
MAYNEVLAQKVRDYFVILTNIEEKAMMGGLTFMYNDKMCVGIIKDELMCRINPDMHEEALEKNGCRAMDFTKRPMKGYVMIDETGFEHQTDFEYWLNLAIAFNAIAKSSKKVKK